MCYVCISVLPEAKIEGYSSPVIEGSLLNLACDITLGNPETMTTKKYWEFIPKYEDTESQVLPKQEGSTHLCIGSTVYSDAGTYRCTVGNAVGSHTDEIYVEIFCEKLSF